MTIYYSQRKASEQQEKPSAHVLMGVHRDAVRRAEIAGRRRPPARRVARSRAIRSSATRRPDAIPSFAIPIGQIDAVTAQPLWG
jgi:hypothetical protein